MQLEFVEQINVTSDLGINAMDPVTTIKNAVCFFQ